ncbi:FtsQ-type POTRA domain-containing protein [Candidatus Sumerlaeota bacterium]|nr:FtsQ-type POTRA domain-containing protein [Candidatus Sumerlaeota bacterium]
MHERIFACFRFLFKAAVICAVLGVAGVFGAQLYAYLFRSERFLLRKVEFSGVNLRIERELIRLSELDLAQAPPNLILLRKSELSRLLLQHPRVKSVELHKSLPDSLHVKVQLRQPVAVVMGDALYLLDREAMVIGLLLPDESRYYDLPYITGLHHSQVALGETIQHESLNWTLAAIDQLSRVNPALLKRFSEFSFERGGVITARLKGGLKVLFGHQPPLEKIVALELFLEKYQAEAKDSSYVDLRFDNQIVYLPKSAQP